MAILLSQEHIFSRHEKPPTYILELKTDDNNFADSKTFLDLKSFLHDIKVIKYQCDFKST